MFSGSCRKIPPKSQRRRLRFSPCNMKKSWEMVGFLIGKSIISSKSAIRRLRSLLWNRPKQRQVLQKASAVGADLISLRFRRLSLTIDNHEKCPKWAKTHLCKWSKSLPGSLLCIDLKHAYLKHTWRIFDACLKHARRIFQAYVAHLSSVCEACLTHTWRVIEVYVKQAWRIFDARFMHASCTFDACLMHVWALSTYFGLT